MVQKLLFENEPMFNGKKELLFTITVSLFTQIACRPTIAFIQSCLSLHPLELRTCMSNLSMNKFWIIEKSIVLDYSNEYTYIDMQGGPVMWRKRIQIKLIDCNMFWVFRSSEVQKKCWENLCPTKRQWVKTTV